MTGYWRTGGHDEPSEPERLERQADEGHGYGYIDPDTIGDKELLSFFGVKSWDEYLERYQSDDPLDPDDCEPPGEWPGGRAETEQTTDTPTEVEQPEQTRAWTTMTEELGLEQAKEYRSFSAAKRDLGKVEGTELHHITEQCQADPKRSGFDVEKINSTDNLTRIPEGDHRQISAYFSRKVPGFDVVRRDLLDGEPWEVHYLEGSEALDKFVKGPEDER